MTQKTKHRLIALPMVALLLGGLISCSEGPPSGRGGRGQAAAGGSEITNAALATYVAPGDLDEYYLFYSGGHSGQIFVAGVPSMRHITTIPSSDPDCRYGPRIRSNSVSVHMAETSTRSLDAAWVFQTPTASTFVPF